MCNHTCNHMCFKASERTKQEMFTANDGTIVQRWCGKMDTSTLHTDNPLVCKETWIRQQKTNFGIFETFYIIFFLHNERPIKKADIGCNVSNYVIILPLLNKASFFVWEWLDYRRDGVKAICLDNGPLVTRISTTIMSAGIPAGIIGPQNLTVE